MDDNKVNVKVGKRIFEGQIIGLKQKFLTIAVRLPIVGAETSITYTFEVSRETVAHCKRENTAILI